MPETRILLNDFERQWRDTREDVLRAVDGVGKSGWYITGTQLAEFERALASLWNTRFCAGVASGLDAIELALRSLGCKPGDRVLTTPLSAFATTLAIVKLGAMPVFVDTDPFGALDLEKCTPVLETRPEIRFLLPVHLYGNPVNLEHLADLKQRFDLKIVEDCAQSVMALYREKMTGSVGQLAATSFYPTKNLGAMGDGGAILTNDEKLIEQVRALRDYGQTARYRHDCIGYNSRLDELHAAILHANLPRLPGWTARRREIASRYRSAIVNSHVRVLGVPAGSNGCFHLFPVIVEPSKKRSFMEYLNSNGITTAEHYPILIPDQKAMSQAPFECAGDCANARAIASGEVSLPIHPYMTAEEVERVIAVCNAWEN